MNEEKLVRYLQRKFTFPQGCGIGDDASVRRLNADDARGTRIVAKDLFVEGTHFSLAHYTLAQAAEKAVGVNVSDMLAMGGEGEEIYLGLGFPPATPWTRIAEAFNGVHRACRRWHLKLAGGDVAKTPAWFFSVTIIGRAVRPVFRNGARAGDLVGLAGRCGESALGLILMQRNSPDPYFSRRHIRVDPPVRAARELARTASAMIDISDGLTKDLSRILSASGVGALIDADKLPISRRMAASCRENGLDAIRLALTGGEDYALLFTIPPHRLAHLDPGLRAVRIIGRIRQSPRRLVLFDKGRIQPPPAGGYDHFAAPEP
ncbi:MAG: thiamine-phosphate kinase [Acidobacteriota bacterium]|jgi:thiamine-monophosphate kinase|nr:thiamine-phosphate kinase [Acidobacteriota bacterium]